MAEQPDNNRQWFHRTADEVLDELDVSRDGLSVEEAGSRLEQYGPNTIRTESEVSAWSVLLNQFTSPLVYVLLAALVVTLGIKSWGDAIVIGIVLVVNGTVGFIQEYRAESAVQSLMKMVSPRARVRRDSREQELEARRLVPGDLVLLSEGDMVPADVRLLETSSLRINESALTGESVPVNKTEEAMPEAQATLPPGDQNNMAFMATAVTAGNASGIVIATGSRTQIGKIAEEVQTAGEIKTPLQRRMDRLAKRIAVVILLVAAIAFGIGLELGNDVEQMFLLAVSLSVAAIPAGLPVVMTVALAIGVRRMARQNAVIRHLPAVETLGSTTSIISDKTGTLTQNRMSVQQIVAAGERYEVTGDAMTPGGEVRYENQRADIERGTPLFHILLTGLLNNSAKLQIIGGEEVRQLWPPGEEHEAPEEIVSQTVDPKEFEGDGDPMETALLIAALKAGLQTGRLRQQYPLIDEIPFQTERRFSATIHNTPGSDDGPLVLVKGAPEVIFNMCTDAETIDGESTELDEERSRQQHNDLASQGLRVLAMAIGYGEAVAESIKSDRPEGMTFVGMVGLMDPPRPEAVKAVDQCHSSGIRVLMVTGDHAQTAAAIARKVHLDRPVAGSAQFSQAPAQKDSAALPDVITGQQVAELSDDELNASLRRVNVFARTQPNQKLRLVDRLKDQSEIVAVTGDGVNDAPALKAGHLGAAMGQTGTDVAKEASDMVITDDNLASVYAAVKEGRTAFRNIRMATFFLLSTGAADVLIILSALAMRWDLPLLPAQILWCNVVTNGIADVALGFEPGEQALYDRPPRPPDEGVLDRMLLERLVVVGVWLAAGVLAVFWWVSFYRNDSLDVARVAALTTLVLFQKVHVFNCRSEDVSIFRTHLLDNKLLLCGVLASLGVHIAALYIPWTQNILRFQPLSWKTWAVSIAVAATAIIVNELHKRLRPRRVAAGTPAR